MKLCVIPARGGSKRIPGKNIKPFAGKPIIAYSIEAAQEWGGFDRIIVSTDDDKIAEVSRQFGAQVPFMRPADISGDMTGTADVVKHAVDWFRQQGEMFEYVCCIYATAPFIQSEYLERGYRQLTASNKSFAFSVTSYDFPVQRALYVDEQQTVEAVWPEHRFTRSQDLRHMYHDAGQFYWGSAEAFLENRLLYSELSSAVILPRHLVQDIDTLEDWTRAELMYQAWKLSMEQGA